MWFREKYGLKFHVREDIWNDWCKVKILKCEEYEEIDILGYEQAQKACLEKLCEIVESNNN